MHAPYQPAGDQPAAIAELAERLTAGQRYQTLLGVTGSGKTFTMAKLIEAVQRPALIIAPNKTLAAQLASELKEFFPNNAVSYFVSYYDYYQPEAYVPTTDTFIEKDASINEEIEKLRHAATSNLLSRGDSIVVASVSCIYGIGSPQNYAGLSIMLKVGAEVGRKQLIEDLLLMQYDRNDFAIERGCFRVRGDVVDIFAPYADNPIRVELFGDEIEAVSEIDLVTAEVVATPEYLPLWPASHYVTTKPDLNYAIDAIKSELKERLAVFEADKKLLEMQRIDERTRFDIEMMATTGFCSGIENYSRHLDRRQPGEPPYTLIDYFPNDFFCIMDESHVSLPQFGAMYEGDRSRKLSLVDHGFRLPCALDNRPLKAAEFDERIPQYVYVSATPGDKELLQSGAPTEQIIRPTGLIDPAVEVRAAVHQIDDLIQECASAVKSGGRVLVTTFTKVMAEQLSDHLLDKGIKSRFMHSDVPTLERVEILHDLRSGVYDVLVGVNLLREGLDLPEVSLVAILDADKEGFLRNQRSLIQTIGRAARNVNGKVIMYADKVTGSMQAAIDETDRRRAKQLAYNEANGIEPASISKAINDILDYVTPEKLDKPALNSLLSELQELPKGEVVRILQSMEDDMARAAKDYDFEKAASLRDSLVSLRAQIEGVGEDVALAKLRKTSRQGTSGASKRRKKY